MNIYLVNNVLLCICFTPSLLYNLNFIDYQLWFQLYAINMLFLTINTLINFGTFRIFLRIEQPELVLIYNTFHICVFFLTRDKSFADIISFEIVLIPFINLFPNYGKFLPILSILYLSRVRFSIFCLHLFSLVYLIRNENRLYF